MENEVPQSLALPRYLMPLLVVSVLLSLIAVVFSAVALVSPINQTANDSLPEGVVFEDYDVECSDTVSCNGDFVCDDGQCVSAVECMSDDDCGSRNCYRGSCMQEADVQEITGTLYRNFTGTYVFSVPQNAVVAHADAGRGSVTGIYESEDLRWDSEGEIFSISFTPSFEFMTGESYSFAEWLEGEGLILTGRSSEVGGLQFEETYRSDDGYVSLDYYVEATEDYAASVISVPLVDASDEKAVFVRDTLNFSPTDAELDTAKIFQ